MPPLLCACSAGSPVVRESVGLVGDGVMGALIAEGGGCGAGALQVGLWGPRFGTEGLVPATAIEEDGAIWVYFSLSTGLGEGEAALRLERGQASLPLGARPGEHEVQLTLGALPDPAELEAWSSAGAARLASERVAWEQGSFLLRDGDQTVGDVQLLGERARVAVYDAFWLTPSPVWTAPRADGPEIVLEFPVEPSLEGEPGLLRLNVPTGRAVVPAERVPTELDRSLELVPGELSDDARDERIDEAIVLADAIEAEQSGALARKLAAEVRGPEGDCMSVDALDPEWRLLLRGYDVTVLPSAEGDTCTVELAPKVPQHGRHLRARFAPNPLP